MDKEIIEFKSFDDSPTNNGWSESDWFGGENLPHIEHKPKEKTKLQKKGIKALTISVKNFNDSMKCQNTDT